MSFEETLRALQAMLGAEVEISVGAAEGAPTIAGTWAGRLAAGSELFPSGPGAATETFYFHLAEDTGSGFFLHAGAFRGARWVKGGGGSSAVLEILSGPLALIVERSF